MVIDSPAVMMALLILALFCFSDSNAFTVNKIVMPKFSIPGSSSSSLSMSTSRQPRRNLKKRRNRDRKGRMISASSAAADKWDRERDDIRPLLKSKQIENGDDYWIDEKELNAFQLRMQAIKNRKAMEGEIPKDKLMDETLAPYKQNWIGFISVLIIVITTLITKFPELLDTPSIPFPDI
eukprot:CAMPEP_0202446180 /NCGR_PEP_ID=MMETSP1360-20130828/4774_1 /ASSEMBLY_ACC=CAM_ASM_000848 /TAXON_ID=515479 /ORGANISM="Licmophora paradoxa, Strain CCMP2313" /LENGTH=179 /DNA_ID=CAMNT_0049062623 /DNA_START=188 /DNA_END=727 /DNA_ORIENTATION=+